MDSFVLRCENITYSYIATSYIPPSNLVSKQIFMLLKTGITKWKQQFELFSAASGLSSVLSDKDKKVQSATLLHVAGPDALEIYNTFSRDTEGDENKVAKIEESFEGYCSPRKNITWEQHVFNTCNQDVGEAIDQYVTKLKTKAKSCEFGALKDSLHDQRQIIIKYASTYH